MKNIISTSIIVPAPLEKVWEFISDFSNADHQVIAVESTKNIGKDGRIVTFKNGHQVEEKLQEKKSNTNLRWSQVSKKGFVPLKNIEGEINIIPSGKDTKLTFSFYYDTIMGPIGWMMNVIMVRKKLTQIAEKNTKKIQKYFSPLF